jgi:glycosyltransferase involved in cell wall biosynthesis
MAATIRICHVQHHSVLAGAQRSMLEIFAALDRQRYEIHVACKGPGPLTEELARLNVPVHFVPSMQRGLHAWSDWRAYRELRSICVKHRFQIVHTHGTKPGLVGRIAARRAGAPVVLHHMYTWPLDKIRSSVRRGLYGSLEQLAAYYCDCLVTVNREQYADVLSRHWMPAEHCAMICPGVDLTAWHPDRKPHFRQHFRNRLGSSEDEFVVLYLGRLVPSKQPLMLAEIAARLDALRPHKPWRLWIAGTGPAEQALPEAIRQHQVAHRVRMIGWQDDPSGVVHAADVVLLPSLAEGLPRSLLEAQAAGIPTVASDIRGNREVVVEGTGTLCPAGDPAAYARALVALIDSPQLRRAQGLAARDHAEHAFDTRVNSRQVVALYEALLAS